jgi:hypothetical protein
MSNAQVAVAWGSPGGATADISISIEEITGARPKPVRLEDLAGPNETIQILLDTEGWILLVKAVGVIYGAELTKEAAKSTWKNAAPKLLQLAQLPKTAMVRLISAVGAAKKYTKASIILGFPRNLNGGRRHIGIEIESESPEDLSRVISLLGRHSEEILHRLDEWEASLAEKGRASYRENSDCSTKISIEDDGSLLLHATVFDFSGKNREEVSYLIWCPKKTPN